MVVGGIVAAWIGAALFARIAQHRLLFVIALLLCAIAVLLVLETYFAESTSLALSKDVFVRAPVALVAGLAVGVVSSLRVLRS